MNDKYIIDEEGEYVIDTETNDMWDATGGGDGIYMLVKKVNKLLEENEQLKSVNMGMEDCLGRLEESNINLRIKLKKIRDYAKEDGEVKQEIIEKVILND